VKLTERNIGTPHLRINYNPNNDTASRETIPILTSPNLNLTCINCYLAGAADIHFEAYQSALGAHSYKLSIIGNLKANLDTQISAFDNKFVQKDHSIPIFNIPFHFKYEIEGILKFEPVNIFAN
jgi:hypothetical protein